MIRIPDLKMPLDYSESSLLSTAAKALRTDENNILKIEIYKKSVDARKKSDVHFISHVHPDFPKRLKGLADCPYGLFYKINSF